MLSCPVNGWTLFSLEGTESQLLSYLDDIAPECWTRPSMAENPAAFLRQGISGAHADDLCGQLLELPYPCGGR